MKLIISSGLKHILDKWCRNRAEKQFCGADHIGALVAVQYKEDYLANMTIPNSLFDRALFDTPEKQYLLENKDIILVPYFHGTTQEFIDSKDKLLMEMHANYPHFPLLLILAGDNYTLYNAATKKQEPLEIVAEMPHYLGDKISQFLGFIKPARSRSIN